MMEIEYHEFTAHWFADFRTRSAARGWCITESSGQTWFEISLMEIGG